MSYYSREQITHHIETAVKLVETLTPAMQAVTYSQLALSMMMFNEYYPSEVDQNKKQMLADIKFYLEFQLHNTSLLTLPDGIMSEKELLAHINILLEEENKDEMEDYS